MKRRDFLKGTLCASALGLTSGFGLTSAWAVEGARPRCVTNTMLLGGADLRHLFVPPFDNTVGSYGHAFWSAREDLYNAPLDPPPVVVPPRRTAQDVWDNDYFHVEYRGKIMFGIHITAEWLKKQFDDKQVAIICNVNMAQNQRHDHAQLILSAGDRTAKNFKLDIPGWGGQLAYQIPEANVLSFTSSVSVFCNGTNSVNFNERVISAPNMRSVALSNRSDPVKYPGNDGRLSRSLTAYYAQRRQTLVAPYNKFGQHEAALRDLGDKITNALSTTTRPDVIQSLYGKVITSVGEIPVALTNTAIGSQIASLYDASLVEGMNALIMNMRVGSMEVNGWDTHDYQDKLTKILFTDLFGVGKAFDILTSQMSADANDKMIFTITSEFGRQLAANGTWGTDHGVGTYMLIFGKQVQGGVYGEMFPQTEITKFTTKGTYINGLTAFERVLGQVCDWVEPGSGDQIFRTRSTLENEPNVDLRAIFTKSYQVSGTTKDGAGILIPLVNITISDATGVVWNIQSDASGNYELPQLIPGTYNLVANAKRFDIPPSTFSIAGIDLVHNLVGTLYTGTVSGRMTTPAGVPLINYEIWDELTLPESKTRTDSNGDFKIVGIKPQGNVQISGPSGYADYTVVPSSQTNFVHPGGNVTINFTATPIFADADMDTVTDKSDNCTNVINQNQRDTNTDGFGNICDADLNNDRLTDLKDKNLMNKARNAFTSTSTYDPNADLNGDGSVNIQDLDLLLKMYGKAPGPSGLVP